MRRRLTRNRIAWTVSLIGLALVAVTVHLGTKTTGSVVLADDLAADGSYGEATKKKPAEKKPLDPPELFVDWPRPQAALLISGEQIGFLEPCGCAGLDNQKGGLKRRHTLVKQLTAQGWPLALVDLGGQVRRYGSQAVIKFRTAIGALSEIGYHAVGFGPQDLRLPTDDLVEVAVNLPDGRSPYVSANVGLFSLDSGFVEPTRVVTVGGRRIGITSVLGAAEKAKINNQDLEITDPAEALRKVVPALDEKSDVMILLSHADARESRQLAKQFPEFDLVVTAGGAAEPPNVPEKINGTDTLLIEVGHKGMYVAVIGLYDDQETPWRYQRVPLDHRFNDSTEMQRMMVRYQKELETIGLDSLGLTGSRHPSGRSFVGSATCGECHTEATAVFKKTPHAHATATLVKLDPPRQFDPECLSCHVTGWEPQKYFPFKSGFRSLETTAHLRTNGCENCHGPGSRHVAAEEGDTDVDDEELERRRDAMRIRLVEGEAEGKLPDGVVGRVTTMCMQCHDLDNSPDFDFAKYWPDVRHAGKE